LSPCQTFRPEQKEWKHLVHPSDMAPTDDPVEAARFIQADDGMALGLFYVRRLPVWQPQHQPTATPADLEREFVL
jgi:2-oxoglutarate ferredoxin oxidoreductase subunit beta